MTPLLIGLAGQMGCGKSSVAEHLHSTLGFAPPLSFADPLKDMACAMLQCTHDELEAWKRSNEPVLEGITVRRLLQTLGTEWGRRTLREDVWLLALQRRLVPLITGHRSSFQADLAVVLLFTVASVARGYLLRRCFNLFTERAV